MGPSGFKLKIQSHSRLTDLNPVSWNVHLLFIATLVRPIQLISPQLRESACECSPITSHLDHLSTRANGFKFTISTSFIFFLNFMIDHITCSPTKRGESTSWLDIEFPFLSYENLIDLPLDWWCRWHVLSSYIYRRWTLTSSYTVWCSICHVLKANLNLFKLAYPMFNSIFIYTWHPISHLTELNLFIFITFFLLKCPSPSQYILAGMSIKVMSSHHHQMVWQDHSGYKS